METLWFALVAGMLALYVVFDGFDLGTGIVHLFVARTEDERRRALQTIGPVWDGNEVWLLAAGGTLYFAFPVLYASSFSGFYLPLMMVLWLFMLRGMAIEFRHHFDNAVWKPFWDVTFSASSALLAIFFGAALGNVVRGVPLDTQARFFLPLWTDFLPGARPGILDWYTVLVGVAAFVALMLHGALWVSLKTDGAVQARARRAARAAWWGVAAATVLVTLVTFRLQPQVPARLSAAPWGAVFPALAVAGLGLVWAFERKGQEHRAFLASCAYLVGMLTSVAFGVYPYVLPSNGDPALGLDIHNAAAGAYGLRVGLVWFVPGMLLVTAYFVFTYRRLAGKTTVDEQGY
jgi:cytochrome d ubiquinol oxidase subunit II